jgi:hypothetical protein
MSMEKLGEKLVNCDFSCEGVVNNHDGGIPPRCLIFEKRTGRKGAVVIGLNPGKAKKKEMKYYIDNGISYKTIVDYWDAKIKHLKYYSHLRALLNKFKIDGSILWSDLVKCQCADENGVIPIQTMRNCINRFLRKEIKMHPDYIIIAVGNRAFEFCALSFPEHLVIGVPHPTGSYGNFSRLMKNIDEYNDKYLDILSNTIDKNGRYNALKIFE